MSSLDQGAFGATPEASLDAEYRALRDRAGVARLAERMIVRVIGSDRVAFMHGMCSQDVKGLAIGAVAPALILTERAHLIADFFLYAEPDALLIEIERALWPATREHLERLLVADDVEFEALDDWGVLDCAGPLAARVVTAIAGMDPSELAQWRQLRIGDIRIANLPRYGMPIYSIIAPITIIEDMASRATSAADGAKTIAISPAARELLRVENGRVRIGIDTDEKTIALEARLDYAISFSKGCYVGQETIERATARGGVKKRLYGLGIKGDRAPSVGAPISLSGKKVGHLSSIVKSPRFGVIGLAIMHQSAWTAGTLVTINAENGEFSATVSELPFG